MRVILSPLQTFPLGVALELSDKAIVAVGTGLTVIVNVWGVPLQAPPMEGVTVMVAVIGDVPELRAENAAILPVPDAAKPMLGVLLVQEKVAPPEPLKLTAVVFEPAQTLWSVGSFTVGKAVAVTLTDPVAVQPPIPVAVTE